MSYISDNASEVDPELRGSVDFNFFESPRKADSPIKMTNGGENNENSVGNGVVDKQKHGGHDHHHHAKKRRERDDDESYDSFSDSGSCTSGCSQGSWSGSSSRSRSPSPSPRNRKDSGSKSGSKNDLDKKSTVDDVAESHHSRSRSSSYSSRSRSRSRSSSPDHHPANDDIDKKSQKTYSQHSVSRDSLKIDLPVAEDERKHKARKKSTDSYSDSYSESDSDMTDVSPLNSREPSPSGSPRAAEAAHGSKEHVSHGRPPRALMGRRKKEKVRIQETTDTVDREQLDFNLLMQAVIELDKERYSDSNGKKVMFIPPHIRKKIEKNYSFDSDKISDIDRENQRLLQEIMRQNGKGRRRRANEPPTNTRMSNSAVNRRREQRRVEEENLSRPSSSSINRRKQMQQIECENLKILQRLQQVKPSKGLARNDQIQDYTRQVTYGVPMADSTFRRPASGYARSTSWDEEGAPSVGSYQSSPSQKARPVSAKVRPQSGRVRPQSAKVNRPFSAKVHSESQRPAWDDRW